jgi:hypothetical protein
MMIYKPGVRCLPLLRCLVFRTRASRWASWRATVLLEVAAGMADRATLTRLGPDSPSVMEKGSQELEDTLAVERKKVRPSPPYG